MIHTPAQARAGLAGGPRRCARRARPWHGCALGCSAARQALTSWWGWYCSSREQGQGARGAEALREMGESSV